MTAGEGSETSRSASTVWIDVVWETEPYLSFGTWIQLVARRNQHV